MGNEPTTTTDILSQFSLTNEDRILVDALVARILTTIVGKTGNPAFRSETNGQVL